MSGAADRFPGLSDDERRTARALEDAFAGLRLERPPPVTGPAEDDRTAAALAAAFGGLTLDRPAPAAAGPPSPARPARRGLRTLGWPAAAAAACLVTAVTVLGPTDASTAWAAVPHSASAADREGIATACAAPLARGLGALEEAGTQAVVGGTPATLPQAGSGRAAVPTRLPALVSLDVRGDLAFAVYQDATWTVSCVVRATGGGGWADQGVQVGPGPAGTTPGLVAGGTTALPDGERVTTVSGAVPAGTTRVTFRLADGTTGEASVVGRTWSAWFPGDVRLDPARLTAYDAAGRATPLAPG